MQDCNDKLQSALSDVPSDSRPEAPGECAGRICPLFSVESPCHIHRSWLGHGFIIRDSRHPSGAAPAASPSGSGLIASVGGVSGEISVSEGGSSSSFATLANDAILSP